MMTKPKRFSIGIDQDLFDWLEAQIKSGIFYSRRHGIEVALSRLKESREKVEKNR
jgi:Arc/MetJ-type ribon-helix-helix transcriptional regulator